MRVPKEGTTGFPSTLLTCLTLLYLNLHKRHLTQIQSLFYQTFRYFVKQKQSPRSLVVHKCFLVELSRGIYTLACKCVGVLKLNSCRVVLVFLLVARGCAQGVATTGPGEVRFTILAPDDAALNEQSVQQILPPIRLAVKAVTDPRTGILPGWQIMLRYRNSNCSSVIGPLAAVEVHKETGESVTYLKFD